MNLCLIDIQVNHKKYHSNIEIVDDLQIVKL